MDYNITYREKDKGIQYIISYKDQLGKWKQKSKQGFKTKRDAKKAALEYLEVLKNTLENDKKISLEYKDMTFYEFKTMFFNHKKLYLTANTMKNYSRVFDLFEYLDDIKMKDISNFNIQRGIDELVKNGNSYKTILTRVKSLKSFFNSAVKEYRIILESPVVDIRVPENKKENDFYILNDNEFKDILNKFEDTPYHLILVLAGTCGLRVGEILGLTWSCIDLKENMIKIDKQWKMLSRENGKEVWGLGDLKTKNSNRTVPIPYQTVTILKDHYRNSPISIDGRLFPFVKNRSLHDLINIKLKKLGYKISVHDLRHYYATKLIANGVDFKTAAKLLGHDVEMTMRTYSHVNDDMLLKANNVIQKIF